MMEKIKSYWMRNRGRFVGLLYLLNRVDFLFSVVSLKPEKTTWAKKISGKSAILEFNLHLCWTQFS